MLIYDYKSVLIPIMVVSFQGIVQNPFIPSANSPVSLLLLASYRSLVVDFCEN